MNLFKFLLGSPEAAGKTAGAIVDGLDKLVLTDEERADNRQKALEWMVEYMKATNGQNVARRLIALIVTALWAWLVVLGVTLHLVGATVKAAYVFSMMQDVVTPAFMLVMTFYFAAGAFLRSREEKKG